MQQPKRQLLSALVLATTAAFSMAPIASAVEVRVTTWQERADELIEIENSIESFRLGQRAQPTREPEANNAASVPDSADAAIPTAQSSPLVFTANSNEG